MKHDMFEEISKGRKYEKSRHEAKLKAMQEALESGKMYQQVRGIYAFSTEQTYKRQCATFINWVAKRHKKVKRFEDARKYVPEYLENCKSRELSPATIKTYAHSIACAYHCNVSDFDFQIPKVSRDDIMRTRNVDESSFAAETEYIHEFAKATGARREGLQKLSTDCLRETEDGHLEICLDEKGGKVRWARVLAGKEEFVKSVVEEAKKQNAFRNDGCKAVFPDGIIPAKEALHQHRHEYAKALYDEVIRNGEHKIVERSPYYCRGSRRGQVYNRTALAIVSYNLGHGQPGQLPHEVNRVGVVVNNYLY